ncbi:hypothetical protein P7C73_g6392, partial [Tremellales sp. Uapishka_1]
MQRFIPTTSRLLLARPLSTSLPRLASSDKGPRMTQGHTTDKSHNLDAQSTASNRGQDLHEGEKKTSGFDAADQTKGKKSDAAKAEADKGQEGSFNDQSAQNQGVQGSMGGKEDASRGSFTDSIKQTLGFDGLKKMHKDKKNFHSSAREWKDKATGGDPLKAARQPKEKGLAGDQNEHLKHKDPKKADKGKGNAAENPSLPSKKKPAASKSLHTTAKASATKPPGGYSKAHEREGEEGFVGGFVGTEAATAYESNPQDTPPEGLPSSLESPYSAEATPGPEPSMKPSSQTPHSSTAVDPPNEALAEAAKEGMLGERNPQPQPEMGEMGNKEAWKHRK